jgi:hypothetical protein
MRNGGVVMELVCVCVPVDHRLCNQPVRFQGEPRARFSSRQNTSGCAPHGVRSVGALPPIYLI